MVTKKTAKAAAPKDTAQLKKAAATALVKKDLKGIKDYASRLNTFLKDPGLAAIRICECCINVD
jgi:hypothetical protein